MIGHGEQVTLLDAKPPFLVRFQEALPSAEPLGLRGLSGNQESGYCGVGTLI